MIERINVLRCLSALRAEKIRLAVAVVTGIV